jgi:hypothetical protein
VVGFYAVNYTRFELVTVLIAKRIAQALTIKQKSPDSIQAPAPDYSNSIPGVRWKLAITTRILFPGACRKRRVVQMKL